MKIHTKLFAAGLLIVLGAGPAYPQKKEILQLTADMITMQQQMKQLQTTLDQNNAVMRGLVEKMADQVNSLSGGMQKIIQTVDSLKAQADNLKAGTDKTASEFRVILTGLNTNVADLLEGLSAVRTQVKSVSEQITSMKTTAEPLAGPEDIWRSAQLDFITGNYDLAIGGYKEFISKFGNHANAPEAQLGIADALFNQKKYEMAVIEYDLFLQNFPQHDKTRAALYKKGLALAEQNQPQQALDTLRKVVKEFPNTSEAANAQAKMRELQRPAQRPPAR